MPHLAQQSPGLEDSSITVPGECHVVIPRVVHQPDPLPHCSGVRPSASATVAASTMLTMSGN